MGLSKHPELPDMPLIMDLARTDEERAIFKLIFGRQVMAWPFADPPGVPQDRVDALRKAFTETMHDKDFLADAAKAKFEIRSVTGAAIQKLVQEIYATPAGGRAQDRGIAAIIAFSARSCRVADSPLGSPSRQPDRDRMPIRDDIIEAIGNTPLIKLKRASEATGCTILGKAEFMNPGPVGQGPAGAADDPRGREARRAQARRARGRGDRRQHRHRARAGRQCARLSHA